MYYEVVFILQNSLKLFLNSYKHNNNCCDKGIDYVCIFKTIRQTPGKSLSTKLALIKVLIYIFRLLFSTNYFQGKAIF